MKVEEAMARDVKCCGPTDSLAEVVRQMWEVDCGAVPIVDGERLVGIITDRDICVALGTRDRTASGIAVAEVMTRDPHTCSPLDDVKSSLKAMRLQKVRRLPVVDKENRLLGILSLSELILRSEKETPRKTPGISQAEVVSTLKGILGARREAVPPATSAPGIG